MKLCQAENFTQGSNKNAQHTNSETNVVTFEDEENVHRNERILLTAQSVVGFVELFRDYI